MRTTSSEALASGEETETDDENPPSKDGRLAGCTQISTGEKERDMSSLNLTPSAFRRTEPLTKDVHAQVLTVFGVDLPMLYVMHVRGGGKGTEMQYLFGPRKFDTAAWHQSFSLCATANISTPFEWEQLFENIANAAHPFSCSPFHRRQLEDTRVRLIACRHPNKAESCGYGGSVRSIWIVELKAGGRGGLIYYSKVYFCGVFFPDMEKLIKFLRVWQATQFSNASLEIVETALLQVRMPQVVPQMPLNVVNASLNGVVVAAAEPPTKVAKVAKAVGLFGW